jgi:hypothetical protein
LKVEGVKLRESEVQGDISKRLVVQGGLVKFPQIKIKNSWPIYYEGSRKLVKEVYEYEGL